MDGSPEFKRFFLKVMEGAPALPARLEPTTHAPPRRGGVVLRDLGAILDHIVQHGGTHLLSTATIGILRERSSAPVLTERVKTLIAQRRLPLQPLSTWVSETRDPALLTAFLLVVLHRDLVVTIQANRDVWLSKYKELIGLRLVVRRHSLRSAAPESVACETLRRELRQEQAGLQATLDLLVARALAFEITYQFLVSEALTGLLTLRATWQQNAI